MEINVRFQVTNENLTSEQQREIRQIVINALEGRLKHTADESREEDIILALLDDFQNGTIPEAV